MYKCLYYCLCLCWLWQSCTSSRLKRTHIRVLNAEQGQSVVVFDTTDHFFERITSLEMRVQTTRKDSTLSRPEEIRHFQAFLQADVQDFTEEEAKRANETAQKALKAVYKFVPKLQIPDTLQLVKTKGAYYGNSVYYTRHNCIIIPANQLIANYEDALMATLIHEIFHIYSRYNPEKRAALYELLGYKWVPQLELSPFLEKRVFRNPDATDIGYRIEVTLRKSGKKIWVIPAILSKYPDIQPMAQGFFEYLSFQLFEVVENAGKWRVVSPDIGYQPEDLDGFYEQIGRNTNYIIHPEEILADNFKILVLRKSNMAHVLDRVDAEGEKLLQKIAKIIQRP